MSTTVWGVTKDSLAVIHKEALSNLEAVVNRLFRFHTEEMDDLAEYLFDCYA